MPSETSSLRGRKAVLSQYYPSHHPKIVEIDRRLAELRAESHVRKVMAEDLSPGTCRRLAGMIRSESLEDAAS